MRNATSMAPAIVSVILLVIAVFGRWPYAFYVLLRFVVCGSAAYLALWAHELRKTGWTWIMGGTALLFNPLIPVRVHRSDWQILDVLGAVIFAVVLVAFRRHRSN